jgi:hypothetical protein
MESWKATEPSSRPLPIIADISGIPRPPESSIASMIGLAGSSFKFIYSDLAEGYRVLSAESSHPIQSSKELLYNDDKSSFCSVLVCCAGSAYPPLENGNVCGETGDTVKDSSELGLCNVGSLEGDWFQVIEDGMLFVWTYKSQL